jgi:formylglycine-generating enzyme required for sulfatase activity
MVRQSGPLPLRVALDYVLQAAGGLEHAHAAGIVHRDIKPGNLLLAETGTVKVLDMGIARALSADQPGGHEELTAAQALLGTAAFMAPEQATNPRRVDGRADVYSLGCTLFYLLTGSNVYDGETAMEIVLAHRERPIPSLRERRPDCPAAVDRLFQRMVAKRPEGRPATMRSVIDELQTQLDGHAGRVIAMRKPGSRPLRAAAALALLATFVGGLVLASMGKLPWQRGAAERSLADRGDMDGTKTIEITPTSDHGAKRQPEKGDADSDAVANTLARHVNFLGALGQRPQTLSAEDAREGPASRLGETQPRALTGRWDWDGEALLSPVTKEFADLALPGKPPEEYVLTLTAERKSGADALRLGLVAGDRPFVVVFDLGSNLTGFGLLDGAGPAEHAARVRNSVFWKERPVTVRCKVVTRDKRTQLDVYVDAERLVAWAGETEALSRPPYAPKDAELFIGSLGSSFRITRLELTPLVNGQPAPRWKTPPLTPKIEMVKVAAGKFWMGAGEDDKEASADQKPRHEVQITRPFLLGKYEVTRDEFIEVMDLAADSKNTDSKDAASKDAKDNQPGRLPIVGVSWLAAVAFCNQLSLRHGLEPYYAINEEKGTVTIRPGPGDGFRLPTEAEWEYACRAGTETKWHFGDDARLLDQYEWHAGNSRGRPQPVGKLKPNPWGLHDMHGNVPEWCWDRYDKEYYGQSQPIDPPGSPRGEQRVVRGGSASHRAGQTASTSRTSLGVTYGTVDPKEASSLPPAGSVAPGSRGVGIRVARSAK